MLHSRTLLFNPIQNSLYLLIQNSHSIPPPHLCPLATTSLFSMSVNLSNLYTLDSGIASINYLLGQRLFGILLGGSDSKESACNVGDLGSIPRLGRSPEGGHGNLLQCSCLENPHGQKCLPGYSPWGLKESNMTEWLRTFTGTAADKQDIWIILHISLKWLCRVN